MKGHCFYMIGVLFSVVYYVHGMENADNKIALTITPSATYLLSSNPAVYAHKVAMLSGFYDEENGVELLEDNDLDAFVLYQDVYAPLTLERVLDQKCNRYPLAWHKKISCIEEDKELVFIDKKIDGQEEIINMPNHIKTRMLQYFLHDVTNPKRNSFDLCYNVALENSQPVDDTYSSLIQYFNFVYDEAEFVPGDAVVFFTRKREHADVVLRLKLFAIALGNKMYLYKLDKSDSGKNLCVAHGNGLRKMYGCRGCARLDPAIGNRKDFINKPFRVLPYRNVKMDICPHKTFNFTVTPKCIIKDCIATWLGGFRSIDGQVTLRPDIDMTGSTKKITYKNAKELQRLLSEGKIGWYPLFMHQKAHAFSDEILTIQLRSAYGGEKKIHVPHYIAQRLLGYLNQDIISPEKQCFHFCKYLCLQDFDGEKLVDEAIPYESQCEIVAEEHLKPGDAIMLFKKNEQGKIGIIKHYAVALGDRIYVSKFFNGGYLLVTHMASMMDCFGCDGFVRIEPGITQYKSFWNVYLPK